ncbi:MULTISPECIES: M20 metallopeptidase family protein [Thermoanaerobacterium]|uniref:Amidohydrolase n=1 Tax=Thermoanaerobacterium xylanolyticum (strain ATCC 49914 / DSM 7097 / LX-11) TaxID=858215 RepID=F6BIM0_THEXL|nr:M20 family metallopeptidase [Thermoanaerobacterium xylanolyticum]AEF16764.1 amidohydrolase [Thermoanaerobacterium xylanolyticum LX-11]
MNEILKEAIKIQEEIVDIRRKIHREPELGFEETKTSELIKKYLGSLGIETKTIAKTGVVGTIYGNGQKTIAIRADIDALPIQEENDLPYASAVPGKMHACGHDVHTAIALGAAKLISKMKDKLDGNVKFIFQPAEETTGGAKPMLDAGVFDDPKVDAIIGLHVDPDLNVGQIGYTYGKAYASSDMFDINVIGKSSHGAEPHKSVDPIAISANIINMIQTVVSRESNPLEPLVITIGSIEGGYARNVIASKVRMSGIIRMLNEENRDKITKRVESIAKNTAEAMGGKAEFNRVEGYPCLINDSNMIDIMKRSAASIVGDSNVISVLPTLGVEDFAYYLKEVPGCFYKLGCGNKEKGIDKPIHNNMFDVDENCIPYGIAIHVLTAINYLQNDSKDAVKQKRMLKNMLNYSDSL